MGSEFNNNIIDLLSTKSSFVGVRRSGNIVHSMDGPQFKVPILEVCSTDFAFTALKEDGTISTWGDYEKEHTINYDLSTTRFWPKTSRQKSDPSCVSVGANQSSFQILKEDGSALSWDEQATTKTTDWDERKDEYPERHILLPQRYNSKSDGYCGGNRTNSASSGGTSSSAIKNSFSTSSGVTDSGQSTTSRSLSQKSSESLPSGTTTTASMIDRKRSPSPLDSWQQPCRKKSSFRKKDQAGRKKRKVTFDASCEKFPKGPTNLQKNRFMALLEAKRKKSAAKKEKKRKKRKKNKKSKSKISKMENFGGQELPEDPIKEKKKDKENHNINHVANQNKKNKKEQTTTTTLGQPKIENNNNNNNTFTNNNSQFDRNNNNNNNNKNDNAVVLPTILQNPTSSSMSNSRSPSLSISSVINQQPIKNLTNYHQNKTQKLKFKNMKNLKNKNGNSLVKNQNQNETNQYAHLLKKHAIPPNLTSKQKSNSDQYRVEILTNYIHWLHKFSSMDFDVPFNQELSLLEQQILDRTYE